MTQVPKILSTERSRAFRATRRSLGLCVRCGSKSNSRMCAKCLAREAEYRRVRLMDRLYRTWRSMLSRCYSPSSASYRSYGGRGIGVCKRWRIFKNFKADMGYPVSLKLTLGRIDNESGYSPENCRWETRYEQVANRRNTPKILGIPICIIARKLGVKYGTVWKRYKIGLPLDKSRYLSNETVRIIRQKHISGRDGNTLELAKLFNVDASTIRSVINGRTHKNVQ